MQDGKCARATCVRRAVVDQALVEAWAGTRSMADNSRRQSAPRRQPSYCGPMCKDGTAIHMLYCIVCPERRSSEVRRCCVELAGASPAAVSAEAPRSRLQSSREIAPAKRCVKSPYRGVCLGRGEQSRRPNPKG